MRTASEMMKFLCSADHFETCMYWSLSNKISVEKENDGGKESHQQQTEEHSQ
jgi:hypothetical protein